MNISKNILLLYLIKSAKWFMLVMPIIVLFYNENGLKMKDILVLQGIYSISIVALEIPSGYMADLWGRKKTIVFGSILGFVGYLIYCFSFNFWGFMLAEIILGLGQSFISGADSALLFETLANQNKQELYVKHEGRLAAFGNLAEAIAGITGGLLATASLRFPFYAQTVVAFIAIPASIMLIEPIAVKKISNKYKYIFEIINYSLFTNKKLRWNIIFSSIVGCSTLTMAWFVQPFMKDINIPISWFGVIWTILNLSVAVTSFYILSIKKLFGDKLLIFSIAIILSLSYILAGFLNSFLGLFILWIFYLFRGIATPLLKEYINILSPSEMRATILSIRNFLIRIIFAVTAPFFGYINDIYSLSATLILAGIIFFILTIIPAVIVLLLKAYR